MVDNKSEFAIHQPATYKLEYVDKHGSQVWFTGTPKQVINHILNKSL